MRFQQENPARFDTCPFCDEQPRLGKSNNGYLRCPQCGLEVAEHCPVSGAVTNEAYDHSKKSPWLSRVQWRYASRWIGNRDLVDIGCGIGSFLEAAMRRKQLGKCYGVEVDEASVQAATNRGISVVDSLPKEQRRRPTCYTFWHSAEHFPPQVLRELLREMSPSAGANADNVVIIAVPNSDAAAYREHGQLFAFFDIQHHSVQFNYSSLERLLQSCGFEIVSRRGIPIYNAFSLFQTILNLRMPHNYLHQQIRREGKSLSVSQIARVAKVLITEFLPLVKLVLAEFNKETSSCITLVARTKFQGMS